jgi:hypothetical protein
MKTFIFFASFLISNIIFGQSTFYKLISNDIRNIATDIDYNNGRIYLSSANQANTIISTFQEGKSLSKLEIANLLPKKFGVFDSTYCFNRLSKYENNYIVSGHNTGKDRETKFHILNSELIEQSEFSITSANAERIGNEGIYIEDSIMYSYGLFQKDEVLNANIVKYDLISNIVIWDKNYKKGKRLNQMWDLQITHDGNFIFIIYHKDADAGSGSNSGYQIVKIDKEGMILDTFNHRDISIDKQRILASKDGSIYYSTDNNPLNPIIPTDGRINKLSENMDSILWSLELPSNAFTDGNRYEIYDYYQAANGDIMACGRVWHMPGGPLVAGLSATWNGFMVRVSQEGVLKWHRIYRLPNEHPKLPKATFGKFRPGQLDKIIETEDGNFVLGGTAIYNNTQLSGLVNGDTLSSIWLMVVDKNGCIEGEECADVIHLDSKKQNTSAPKLVNDKVRWTENNTLNGITESKRYKFSNDSILYSPHYYRELISSDEETGNSYVGLTRYFREENNRIYEYFAPGEKIIYDFNLNLSDSFTVPTINSNPIFNITVSQVQDSVILLNGDKRKAFEMNCFGIEQVYTNWIEGIGSKEGFLTVYESCFFDINRSLQCFYINDILVYMNPESSGCWTTATNQIEVPKFLIIPNPSSDKIEIKGDIHFDKINRLCS